MIRKALVALFVVALAVLASYGVWLNSHNAHRAGVEACGAVNDSNGALVAFLRRELAPDARTTTILNDLARNDAKVYAACLTKVP